MQLNKTRAFPPRAASKLTPEIFPENHYVYTLQFSQTQRLSLGKCTGNVTQYWSFRLYPRGTTSRPRRDRTARATPCRHPKFESQFSEPYLAPQNVRVLVESVSCVRVFVILRAVPGIAGLKTVCGGFLVTTSRCLPRMWHPITFRTSDDPAVDFSSHCVTIMAVPVACTRFSDNYELKEELGK